MEDIKIEKIKEDFKPFKDDVEGILLFGSSVENERTRRSDIDICLVKPKSDDVLLKVFEKVGGKYDVKVFEKLPLTIKIEIIKKHEVLFGDEVELSYYFYRYRKLWKDNKPRIERNSFEDVEEMIEARNRWLNDKGEVYQKD
ncbi:MAG: nucleotidyltransferase domain-containing protein [Candidatus Thermoplasmatota archaeon]